MMLLCLLSLNVLIKDPAHEPLSCPCGKDYANQKREIFQHESVGSAAFFSIHWGTFRDFGVGILRKKDVGGRLKIRSCSSRLSATKPFSSSVQETPDEVFS
jgi:hypothetical protein